MAFQVEEGGLPYCLWENNKLGMKGDREDFTPKGRIRGVTDMGTLVETQRSYQLCWLGSLHSDHSPQEVALVAEPKEESRETRPPAPSGPAWFLPTHLTGILSFLLSVS